VIDPWRSVARGLFEAYLALDAEVITQEIRSPAEFKHALANIVCRPAEFVTVLGAYCKGQATLRVLEGSHVTDGANGEESESNTVHPAEYILSSENLVMLDARVKADLILLDDTTIDLAIAKMPRPA
jgi:hypothetical protein